MDGIIRGNIKNRELIKWAEDSLKGKREIFVWGIIQSFLAYFISLVMGVGLIIGITPFAYGLHSMALSISRMEYTDKSMALSGLNKLWLGFKVSIFLYLSLGLKLIPFVIPFFFGLINYSQVFFVMNDNPNMGALEIIAESKKIIKGYRKKFCGFLGIWFLRGLIYILPLILFIILIARKELVLHNEIIGILSIVISIGIIFTFIVKFIPEYLVSAAAFYDNIKISYEEEDTEEYLSDVNYEDEDDEYIDDDEYEEENNIDNIKAGQKV